jgi:hypothetical protein
VPADAAVIEARDVFKVFIGGGDRHSRRAFLALRDVNLLIEPGQTTARASAKEGVLWTNAYITK